MRTKTIKCRFARPVEFAGSIARDTFNLAAPEVTEDGERAQVRTQQEKQDQEAAAAKQPDMFPDVYQPTAPMRYHYPQRRD
jgi:hypothetical protein